MYKNFLEASKHHPKMVYTSFVCFVVVYSVSSNKRLYRNEHLTSKEIFFLKIAYFLLNKKKFMSRLF